MVKVLLAMLIIVTHIVYLWDNVGDFIEVVVFYLIFFYKFRLCFTACISLNIDWSNTLA